MHLRWSMRPVTKALELLLCDPVSPLPALGAVRLGNGEKTGPQCTVIPRGWYKAHSTDSSPHLAWVLGTATQNTLRIGVSAPLCVEHKIQKLRRSYKSASRNYSSESWSWKGSPCIHFRMLV